MFTHKTKELPSTPKSRDDDSDDSMERALRAPSTIPARTGRSLFRKASGKQMYLSVNPNGSVTSLETPPGDDDNPNRENLKSANTSDNENKSLLIDSTHKTTFHRNDSVRAANAPEIMVTNVSPRRRIQRPANLEIPDELKSGRKKPATRQSTRIEHDNDITLSDQSDFNDMPLREISLDAKNQTNPTTRTTPQSTGPYKRLSFFSNDRRSKEKTKLRQLSDELDGRDVTHEHGSDLTKPTSSRQGTIARDKSFAAKSNSMSLLPIHIGVKPLKRKNSDVISNSDSIPSSPESDIAYLALVEQIGIERVFFNPELEIVNRVCLEYTALCVATEERWTLRAKHVDHYSRVYQAMERRMESTSTPIIDTAPSVSTPVLLTMLFLDRFRIKSNDTINLQSQVPLLSHNNKMAYTRFRTIIRQCFDRRAYFLRKVDISRHGLDDLA